MRSTTVVTTEQCVPASISGLQDAKLITFTQARERLGGEGKTAFHNRLKRDPTFPRPVYLSEREPRIFAHELDRWMADLAASRDEKSALARRQLKAQEADHVAA